MDRRDRGGAVSSALPGALFFRSCCRRPGATPIGSPRPFKRGCLRDGDPLFERRVCALARSGCRSSVV